jgi:hypothetical protein
MPSPLNEFSLDDYFAASPMGSIDRAIGNNLYGVNHRQITGIIPSNRDLYGLTFFVRPQLNLTSDNIRNLRIMYKLLNSNERSIQRFARCTLDPRLMYSGSNSSSSFKCPIVDPLQCFIPALTNNLKSISGWPDITVDTFSSKEGLYKENYSQVDGTAKIYSEFDLDATFRNTRGDPILYLLYIWANYESSVFEGTLVPYPDFIVNNRIDYNTRIYRLVLDQHRKTVTKIAATGVSFPISLPMGQYFDYSAETPYNEQTKEIVIRFKSLGAIYQDDILIHEFNKTVVVFNPSMDDQRREQSLLMIPSPLLPYFNNRGYPRINPKTHELEWWVSLQFFNTRSTRLRANGLLNATLETFYEEGD